MAYNTSDDLKEKEETLVSRSAAFRTNMQMRMCAMGMVCFALASMRSLFKKTRCR